MDSTVARTVSAIQGVATIMIGRRCSPSGSVDTSGQKSVT
jgi:hypothetical protein